MSERNIAKCAICGDIIESTYRHHFISCKCGEISLDGGSDYRRAIFNDRKNLLELTEEELAAWDEVPTGRLEDWACMGGTLFGTVYANKHRWFKDGSEIRTTKVVSGDLKEGGLVQTTGGSTYLLGKKFKERRPWTSKVEEEAGEVGVHTI